VNNIVNDICFINFNKYPDETKHFQLGYGNYVFRINLGQDRFIVRINTNEDAYRDTIYWLELLRSVGIAVPKVIYKGKHSNLSYLIMDYIDGDDLGNVYVHLSDKEKREIARAVVNIQNAVAALPQNHRYGYLSLYNDENSKKSWKEVILEHLNRSRGRIKENKIFDYKKVDKIEELLERYDTYLNSIRAVPFLDDLSTKNVLINQGKLSGVIDIDWICFGDKIYFAALTNMALISLGYDTTYVDFLMEEMKASAVEREVLILYTLIFCVDFMSEKGMKFKDEIVTADEGQIFKLNRIYEEIYSKLEV
jgi:fructosamine-3-kinase